MENTISDHAQPPALNWVLGHGPQPYGRFFFTDWFRAVSECRRYSIEILHKGGLRLAFNDGTYIADKCVAIAGSIIEALVLADEHNATITEGQAQ
jgi:hypothetical protein